MHDQLADHAVVMGRDPVAVIDMGIYTHAEASRGAVKADQPRTRCKVAVGVFRVDTALDRVSAEHHILLLDLQGFARSNADLFLDDIDPADHFGDGVLHLDAGIHFHKVEIIGLGVQQELNGPGGGVMHRFCRLYRRFHELFPGGGADGGGRRLFDKLLVSALHGAIALAETDHVAVVVRQDLGFDMLRVFHKLFDIHIAVAEGAFRLSLRRVEALDQAVVVVGDPHTASAAARRRLHDDRIGQFMGDFQRLRFGLNDPVATRRDGHFGIAHGLTGDRFIAHGFHLFRRGPDESDIAAFADFGEVRVFREEPVAGVDRIHIADLRHGDDPFDQQITLGAGGGADTYGFIRKTHRQTVFVRFGIDNNGFDAHFFAGAHNAQSDFAAVGDQDFVKHSSVVFRSSFKNSGRKGSAEDHSRTNRA